MALQFQAFSRRAPRLGAALAWVMALGLGTAAHAQTPLKCAQVLTADQVKSVLGAALDAVPPKQHEAGESECLWRRNGANVIAVRFFDRQAIGSNPVTRTPDGYFEMLVKAGEEVGDKKREAVAGVPRAVLIQASPQILVVVQRTDGVARIVLSNLTRAQAVNVAKLVAGS